MAARGELKVCAKTKLTKQVILSFKCFSEGGDLGVKYYLFLKLGLMLPRLSWNWLCSPGWVEINSSPLSLAS